MNWRTLTLKELETFVYLGYAGAIEELARRWLEGE